MDAVCFYRFCFFLRRENVSKSIDETGLIKIGSCPLHLIHNSFKQALEKSDWSIEEMIDDLFVWFHRSPSRRQDFLDVSREISEETGKFIPRFVSTRWLEIGPIVDRILEQWNNLRRYFLEFLPSKENFAVKTARFVEIQKVLRSNKSLIRLKFIAFVHKTIYEPILRWFQQNRTLIHLLHERCENLIRRVFSSFVKENLLRGKSVEELMKIEFHLEINQKNDRSKTLMLNDKEFKTRKTNRNETSTSAN